MGEQFKEDPSFYESFWSEAHYQYRYAFDSAVRDRFPAIEKVWGSLAKPATVLDYGCGNGVLTYWMKCNGFGKTILGVDISRTGIESARKAFACDGIQYEDLDWFSSSNEKFDVLVSSHVLEHLENPAEILRTLLAQAEWFVIEVPLESCVWANVMSKFSSKPRRDNSLGHLHFWTRKQVRELMESSGYLILRDYHYASAPFSPYTSFWKGLLERMILKVLGLNLYSKFFATHYIVLARQAQ